MLFCLKSFYSPARSTLLSKSEFGTAVVTAAIVLWNTVYTERAIGAQREAGKSIDDELLQYLSPLGWEHINLTGDYVWWQNKATEAGQFRSLRLAKMLK